ncbi:MAG: hypothetical protein ACRD44_18460 [Bryobacteraceae bacterium]
MSEDLLGSRREWLLKRQNPDGGWGYFPGKQSWLEPTAYAILALQGESSAHAAVERAWAAVRSWQAADGGWRPGAGVDQPGWGTALAVTLHCARGILDGAFERGLGWLVRVKGDEGALWKRVINRLQPGVVGHDASVQGWPWLPKNTSWVEPTTHALIALNKSLPALRARGWRDLKAVEWRIDMARRMLADRRCADGGWNYGNKLVQNVTLPSYPETTALALLGLRDSTVDLGPALAVADGLYRTTRSRLARAWLALALRIHGREAAAEAAPAASNDLVVTALEALAAPGGNLAMLLPGGGL